MIEFYDNEKKISLQNTIYLNPTKTALEYGVVCKNNEVLYGRLTERQLCFEIKNEPIIYYKRFKHAIIRAIIRDQAIRAQKRGILIDPVLFIRVPFAASGDRAIVPIDPAVDNSMSYTDGFTPPYEGDWPIDPTAIPIPRDQMNQALYDLSNALNQYQTHGFPDFITSADNGGSPFPYDIYAVVRYDAGDGDKLYVSQVDNNTSDPTNAIQWSPVGAPVVALISMTGTQNISNTVLTTVAFDTVVYDDYNMFDPTILNHNFTVKFPGYYEFSAISSVFGNNPASDMSIQLDLYKGFTSLGSMGRVFLLAGKDAGCVGGSTVLAKLAAGDTLTIKIYQSNGGSLSTTIGGDGIVNYVRMHYLGPQP